MKNFVLLFLLFSYYYGLGQWGQPVLGTNQNDYETLRFNFLDVGGINLNSVTWVLRAQSGNGWQTAQLFDGISIDSLYPTLNARTWWKRDPYNNIHSWGDQANTYLTINQGNVGIGRSPASNRLEVNGNTSKTVAGGWLANSDKRIKTDIQDIDNSLELIKKLHPVKFKYTAEWMKKNPTIKDQYYYNFIAQEFQKVFPEAVKGSGEFIEGDGKEILQIDTYNAQIVSIKAIQEQQKIIDAQQKFIDTQQEEIDNLKKELESIKNYLNIEARADKKKLEQKVD